MAGQWETIFKGALDSMIVLPGKNITVRELKKLIRMTFYKSLVFFD